MWGVDGSHRAGAATMAAGHMVGNMIPQTSTVSNNKQQNGHNYLFQVLSHIYFHILRLTDFPLWTTFHHTMMILKRDLLILLTRSRFRRSTETYEKKLYGTLGHRHNIGSAWREASYVGASWQFVFSILCNTAGSCNKSLHVRVFFWGKKRKKILVLLTKIKIIILILRICQINICLEIRFIF